MPSQQWIAFMREANISAQSLSEGLGTLRKANYSSTGLYGHAFFNISIGLERILKIIFMLDWALKTGGAMPTDQDLRKFGHDILVLFEHAEKIQKSMKSDRYFEMFHSDNEVEREILKFISIFAKRTRYYNLDYLVGSSRAGSDADPIAHWYRTVGAKIFARHLTTEKENKINANAALIDHLIGPYSSVSFTSEDGKSLTDVFSASRQTGMNQVLQKYGTFYFARLIRYLYIFLYERNNEVCSTNLDIPMMYEAFFTFMNEDRYLLSRKTFPPRGQGR